MVGTKIKAANIYLIKGSNNRPQNEIFSQMATKLSPMHMATCGVQSGNFRQHKFFCAKILPFLFKLFNKILYDIPEYSL